jgi:uncharacterized membrane protein
MLVVAAVLRALHTMYKSLSCAAAIEQRTCCSFSTKKCLATCSTVSSALHTVVFSLEQYAFAHIVYWMMIVYSLAPGALSSLQKLTNQFVSPASTFCCCAQC